MAIDKLNPIVYKGVRPIPAIPTVYTDALSYGEQLGIIGHKADECVDKVNEVVEDNNTFKAEITEQQDTFETNITEQQDTFETNITNQQNTYEQQTTSGLNTWKTNTKAEYKEQIDALEDEWDGFIEEYEQVGEVTQNALGDNILLVTSQKAVNDGLKKRYGDKNLLYKSIMYNNKVYDLTAHDLVSHNSYVSFELDLTANTTYYFNYVKRLAIKEADSAIVEDTTFNYHYTPTENVTIYVSYEATYPYWIVATSNDLNGIAPFDNGITKDIEDRYHGNLTKANNELFKAFNVHYNYYKGTTSPVASNNYTYFDVWLEQGHTYKIFPSARYVVYDNQIVQDETNAPFNFAPETSGLYQITFYNNNTNWKIVESTNDIDKCCGYNSTSFSKVQLAQKSGNRNDIPMSQNAVSMLADNYFMQNNLLFSAEGVHYNYYKSTIVSPIAHTNYTYFDVTLLAGHTYYFYPSTRFIVKGTTLIQDETNEPSTVTINETGTYQVTFYNANPNWIILADSTDISKVCGFNNPSFSKTQLAQTTGTREDIPMSQKAVTNMLVDSGNILANKKYVACGDSFTGNNGQDDRFTDQPYQGQLKMYPFFIGRKYAMNVVNMAVGGMTMAKKVENDNDFSTSAYLNVPSDADYITLKFGINDAGYGVPIGTITDEVNTTYYGAWNIVMASLISRFTTKKIGIIISNGISVSSSNPSTALDYAEATINIAKKYGIPYLNEFNGEQVPILIRSGRTDVDASVITAKNNAFKVADNNLHPNTICQEFESTIVGEWLKTL